ncbi:MAG: Protein YhfA, partial [Pseudomonadota bacterium]
KGENLDKDQVERAIKLSAEKYCSASIMLSKSVEITHDFEIKEGD